MTFPTDPAANELGCERSLVRYLSRIHAGQCKCCVVERHCCGSRGNSSPGIDPFNVGNRFRSVLGVTLGIQRRKCNHLRRIVHTVVDLYATRCFRNGWLPRRQAENKVGFGAYGRGLLPRHRSRFPVLGGRRACDRRATHFGDWIDRQRWNSGWGRRGYCGGGHDRQYGDGRADMTKYHNGEPMGYFVDLLFRKDINASATASAPDESGAMPRYNPGKSGTDHCRIQIRSYPHLHEQHTHGPSAR